MRISLPLGHVCSKICLATCLKLAKGQKLNRARQIISQKDPIIIFIESLLRTGRYLTCVISKHHDNPETEPSNFIGGKTENKRGWVTGPMVHSCKWQSQDKIQVCLRSSGTISCLMSMTSKFGIFVQILVHKLYFIKDVFGVNPAGMPPTRRSIKFSSWILPEIHFNLKKWTVKMLTLIAFPNCLIQIL